MQVRVLFFGRLREVVGAGEEQLELAEGASVEDLLKHYQQRFPQFGEFRPSLAVAVNQEYAKAAQWLQGGDEIALLPPVSGGAPVEIIELTDRPIQAHDLAARLKAPNDGAVVIFDGIVRDHSLGRTTLYLDYEAYEPMALKQMQAIVADIRCRFEVDGIALVHRLGRLEIGETSVVIAVSSAHRASAFDACRYAIETLKRTVPIWKKEYFADGAVWVEGERAGVIAGATVRRES